MLLQCFCNVLAMLFKCCCNIVAMLLQWLQCYCNVWNVVVLFAMLLHYLQCCCNVCNFVAIFILQCCLSRIDHCGSVFLVPDLCKIALIPGTNDLQIWTDGTFRPEVKSRETNFEIFSFKIKQRKNIKKYFKMSIRSIPPPQGVKHPLKWPLPS